MNRPWQSADERTPPPSDADIAALRDEAAAAGDEAQVDLCDSPGTEARAKCVRVILDAQAQDDQIPY